VVSSSAPVAARVGSSIERARRRRSAVGDRTERSPSSTSRPRLSTLATSSAGVTRRVKGSEPSEVGRLRYEASVSPRNWITEAGPRGSVVRAAPAAAEIGLGCSTCRPGYRRWRPRRSRFCSSTSPCWCSGRAGGPRTGRGCSCAICVAGTVDSPTSSTGAPNPDRRGFARADSSGVGSGGQNRGAQIRCSCRGFVFVEQAAEEIALADRWRITDRGPWRIGLAPALRRRRDAGAGRRRTPAPPRATRRHQAQGRQHQRVRSPSAAGAAPPAAGSTARGAERGVRVPSSGRGTPSSQPTSPTNRAHDRVCAPIWRGPGVRAVTACSPVAPAIS
jgi:hypothetical protein